MRVKERGNRRMKRVLVIENYRFGKEYLKRAKKLGYETILATYQEPEEVDENDKKNIDYYVKVDTTNLIETINEIVRFYDKVSFHGVLAGHVFLMPHVAGVTDQLGLPSFGFNAANATTFKDQTRKKLASNGLFPFYYAVVDSMEALAERKNEYPFPVVMKPIDGFASINVRIAKSFKELEAAYKEHMNNNAYGSLGKEFSLKVLIEEYIPGKEYSVESIVENGEVNFVTITQKRSHSKFKHVETGHIVPAANLLEDEIYNIKKYVESVHKVLGVSTGMTHTEIKWDGHQASLIELNPRIGGGYIPELIKQVFDIDMYEAAVLNCVGERFLKSIKNNGSAFVGYVLAPKIGLLRNIQGLDALQKSDLNLSIQWLCKKGSQVKSSKDNRGRILRYHGYTNTCDKDIFNQLSELESMLTIEIE
jgi:biotin carboxylase